jgi:hypothetical protein
VPREHEFGYVPRRANGAPKLTSACTNVRAAPVLQRRARDAKRERMRWRVRCVCENCDVGNSDEDARRPHP